MEILYKMPLLHEGLGRWMCRCPVCGGEKPLYKHNIENRAHEMCQKCILSSRNNTHGLSTSKHHNRWRSLRQLCNNPNHKRYPRYGGRGIKVCEEWCDFTAFHKWCEAQDWSDGRTILRIDNDGDFSPDNCKVSNKGRVSNTGGNRKKVIKRSGRSRKEEKAYLATLTLARRRTYLRKQAGQYKAGVAEPTETTTKAVEDTVESWFGKHRS